MEFSGFISIYMNCSIIVFAVLRQNSNSSNEMLFNKPG